MLKGKDFEFLYPFPPPLIPRGNPTFPFTPTNAKKSIYFLEVPNQVANPIIMNYEL